MLLIEKESKKKQFVFLVLILFVLFISIFVSSFVPPNTPNPGHVLGYLDKGVVYIKVGGGNILVLDKGDDNSSYLGVLTKISDDKYSYEGIRIFDRGIVFRLSNTMESEPQMIGIVGVKDTNTYLGYRGHDENFAFFGLISQLPEVESFNDYIYHPIMLWFFPKVLNITSGDININSKDTRINYYKIATDVVKTVYNNNVQDTNLLSIRNTYDDTSTSWNYPVIINDDTEIYGTLRTNPDWQHWRRDVYIYVDRDLGLLNKIYLNASEQYFLTKLDEVKSDCNKIKQQIRENKINIPSKNILSRSWFDRSFPYYKDIDNLMIDSIVLVQYEKNATQDRSIAYVTSDILSDINYCVNGDPNTLFYRNSDNTYFDLDGRVLYCPGNIKQLNNPNFFIQDFNYSGFFGSLGIVDSCEAICVDCFGDIDGDGNKTDPVIIFGTIKVTPSHCMMKARIPPGASVLVRLTCR
ncbi:MAG: hypothetical protein N3D73_02255 [Candidatus Diapherotrites archaeon]|nr:hypothetical protein [Candidatus Diapherotrites archaeon]